MCVCVLGGRNPSLMMETADPTLRMLSITGVTRDVGDVKSSRDCGLESHPGGCVDVPGCFVFLVRRRVAKGIERILQRFKNLKTETS